MGEKKNKKTGARAAADERGHKIPVEDPEVEICEDAEDAAENTEGSGESGKAEEGFDTEDGGKEDPDSASKAAQAKIDGLEDRVKRQMAEFENYRKRTEREKQQMFSMGEKEVLEKMLPVVDNLERGLAAVPEDEADSAIASGMEMIYKQMVKQFEDLGVTPIEAVGKPFDPNFHNAVMQVESDEYPSGTVAQEFQKGYMYHDTVLRHSMVGVVS